MTAFAGRIPPHSTGAEVSVLGSILIKPRVLDEVLDILEPRDFYGAANSRIYEAMRDLSAKGTTVDIVTLSGHLEAEGDLARCGGREYMISLPDAVVTAVNALEHARMIVDRARVRAVISAAMDIMQRGYGEYGNAEEYVVAAEGMIMDAARDRNSQEARPVSEIVKETIAYLQSLKDSGAEMFGLPVGIPGIDDMLCGLQPASYYIIGAATSMGKTTLAIQIAIDCGVPVYLASKEMSQRQVCLKMIAANAGISVNRLLRPQYWGREKSGAIYDGARAVYKLPITIDDRSKMTPQHIWSRARRLKASKNVGLVICDYLQILSVAEKVKGRGREQEVAAISADLKAMAGDLGMPVIALAQLNRVGAKDRPELYHLRESGSIENDADAVILLWRPEKGQHKPDTVEPTEVILAKNRITGPIGSVACEFDPVRQRIVQRGTQEPMTAVQDLVGDSGDIFND